MFETYAKAKPNIGI